MSLSNTAVPKYYGQFRADVLSGKIPVNHEVSMRMNQIDALIENPKYYYDSEAIDGFVRFCENELTLTDGTDLHLLETFKLWAEDLLSWFYFVSKKVYNQKTKCYERKIVKKRLVNKQYLIVGRGAAKSMYASCIQAYFVSVDPRTTHQITTAPTMKQSDEVLDPIRTALMRARGPLYKFLSDGSLQNTTGSKMNRKKMAPTKEGIQNFLTNSIIQVRPMSIDKLQGLRCFVSTVDEWLSGDTREDPIGAIEQGASKMDDYIIVAISSEGTVRNGVGDSIKIELTKILKNELVAPHVSIWWYKLDKLEEVDMPEMWLKANPNIGKTTSYESYVRDVEKAEKNPSARNDILAKRFGLPMEGYTYFFTYEETELHPMHNYWRMPCSMGADMSRGDDFCSFTFLFPLSDGSFGIKTRNYITDYTYSKLHRSLQAKYDEFIAEGSLVIMENNPVLNMMEIYDDIDRFIIENNYSVISFGYDPYNAKEFVERWCRENGEYGVEKVIQGARTESVPLGELKKFAEERMLIFDEEIMKFAMGNAIAVVDNNNNKKLYKVRHDQKIDPVAAMLDAYVAWKLNIEMF